MIIRIIDLVKNIIDREFEINTKFSILSGIENNEDKICIMWEEGGITTTEYVEKNEKIEIS